MIQRIQSVFLLVAAILLVAGMFFTSVVLTTSDGVNLFFTNCGVDIASEGMKSTNWGIVTMVTISTLLTLVALFLFKNRKRQVKVLYITSLFIIFYYITFMAYLCSLLGKIEASVQSVNYGIGLPAIALLFIILAIVKIKKDEKLVQTSLNRIR